MDHWSSGLQSHAEVDIALITSPPTEVTIVSPKQDGKHTGRSAWFPYYAGYSDAFVRNILGNCIFHQKGGSSVLDPWNGAGTTSSVAYELGCRAIGYDISPVMIVVARARLLQANLATSLTSIAEEILEKSRGYSCLSIPGEPLTAWFTPQSASSLRHISNANL